ncbi:MAG: hypothetical protein ACOYVD_16340 [Bacillota bacterium]
MTVIGVRCLKDEVFVAVLEGTRIKPIITDKARVEIILKAPKTAVTRAEKLNYLKREFLQLIDKYKPNAVSIKNHESSPHRVNIHSTAQRGEIEGIIQDLCYEARIPVEGLLYTQIKTKLKFTDKSKKFQMEKVEENFELGKLDDNSKDAILCAWAVLE